LPQNIHNAAHFVSWTIEMRMASPAALVIVNGATVSKMRGTWENENRKKACHY
jgi:hypothetical protein